MRTLSVVVSGNAAGANEARSKLAKTAVETLTSTGEDPQLLKFLTAPGEPDRKVCEQSHLVVHVGPTRPAWADVALASPLEAEGLVMDRLIPWTTKWNAGRRAPRAQVAIQTPHDPAWVESAQRLIARLSFATAALPVVRIDHIGSTSVPGLTAKNLVDIQILVAEPKDALPIALAATNAGFSHVAGDWFGLDRFGNQHREEVLVDSDPGRPVNCNIRSMDTPVGRDALLFRDWLRADASNRSRYQALKTQLAGQNVNDYSAQKEPFISAALVEAEESDAIWKPSTFPSP